MSMKIKFKYVFLLFSLLGITACDEKDDPIAEISIDQSALTFEAAADTKNITVAGVTTVEVAVVTANPEVGPNDEPWYDTKFEGSVIKVSVKANLTSGNRTASFSISSGKSEPVSFSITQDGSRFSVSKDILEFGERRDTLTIEVTNTAEEEYGVDIEYPEGTQEGDKWLTYFGKSISSLTLIVKPSNTFSREITVNLTLGGQVIPLTIKQVNFTGTYTFKATDYDADGYWDRTFTKVILKANDEEDGTYILMGKFPSNIYSIQCTYQEGKLVIHTGQDLGEFGAPFKSESYLYAAYGDVNGTAPLLHSNDVEASYAAPLSFNDDDVINFVFAAGITGNNQINGIAVKNDNKVLNHFFDIKLTWVSDDLTEPTSGGGSIGF
ncbi:hypothetical protein EZS27_014421 [termite gut metagenome]|uniref:BACON domain-containing protein n=1 Tax=termite gut metagenome TaxID=433724 RepID=A0A5J4RU30_9ZZZZ